MSDNTGGQKRQGQRGGAPPAPSPPADGQQAQNPAHQYGGGGGAPPAAGACGDSLQQPQWQYPPPPPGPPPGQNTQQQPQAPPPPQMYYPPPPPPEHGGQYYPPPPHDMQAAQAAAAQQQQGQNNQNQNQNQPPTLSGHPVPPMQYPQGGGAAYPPPPPIPPPGAPGHDPAAYHAAASAAAAAAAAADMSQYGHPPPLPPPHPQYGDPAAAQYAHHHHQAGQYAYPPDPHYQQQGQHSNHRATPSANMAMLTAEARARAGSRSGRNKSVPPSEAWELRFKELQAFHAEFGHADVPQSYKKNKPLGKWVGKQREHWKVRQDSGSSPLTEQRIAKLRTLDFKFFIGKGQHAKIHGVFMTDNMMEGWDARFKALDAFKEEHGHCDVPARYPPNKSLAAWVLMQRRKFREFDLINPPEGDVGSGGVTNAAGTGGGAGGDDSSTANDKELKILRERRKRLEDIGFKFDIGIGKWDREKHAKMGGGTKSHEDAWTAKLEALREYKAQTGGCDVPITYKEDPSLATWVSKQREMWRNRQTGKGRVMSDDRLERLTEIGFSFEAYEASWTAKLEELREYKEKHGTVNVKDCHNRKLWHWSRRQRETFKQYLDGNAGPMTNERITKLEELGFDWKYEDTFKKMEKSKNRSKSKPTEPKKKKSTGRPRKNPVPESSATAAAAAPAATEEDKAGDVEEAVAQLPPLNVPTDADVVQMEEAEDSKPPAVEEQFLASAGDTATAAAQASIEIANAEAALAVAMRRYGGGAKDGRTNTKPEKWLAMYAELIQYKKDHGDCKVQIREQEYNRLGPWVKLQREEYRKMKENKPSPMCRWRIELLEKIGFDFQINARKPASFEERFAQLEEFKAEFGHCNVPQAWVRNVPLGKWVSKIRDHRRFLLEGKKSRLNQEQIDQLEAIGFQWFVGKGKGLRTWDGYFYDLQRFKEKYGHYNVPIKFEDNPALATWAQQQRVNFRNELIGKAKLPKILDHNNKLREIGFNPHIDETAIMADEGDKKKKGGDRKRKPHAASAKKRKSKVEDEEKPAKRHKKKKKKNKSSDADPGDNNVDLVPVEGDGPDEEEGLLTAAI